jgi:hypothetical protein
MGTVTTWFSSFGPLAKGFVGGGSLGLVVAVGIGVYKLYEYSRSDKKVC